MNEHTTPDDISTDDISTEGIGTQDISNASGAREAAGDLARRLGAAGLSCAVNPYDRTMVIIALGEGTIAPYVQEAPGEDEDRDEFVPSMSVQTVPMPDGSPGRLWQGAVENVPDVPDDSTVPDATAAAVAEDLDVQGSGNPFDDVWTWTETPDPTGLPRVAAAITATIHVLRTRLSDHLAAHDLQQQAAARAREAAARALAEALRPADVTISPYPGLIEVHFRTGEGLSGRIQIHAPSDARLEITRTSVPRLTALARALQTPLDKRPATPNQG